MILIRKDVVKLYLGAAGESQAWLARKLGYTEGYLSQVMTNSCKIGPSFMENLAGFTHFSFDRLFVPTGEPDTREFYGEVHIMDGRMMNKREYYAAIRKKQTFTEKDLYRDKKDYSSNYFKKNLDGKKII